MGPGYPVHTLITIAPVASERVRQAPDPPSGPVIDDVVFDRLVADLGAEHIQGVCRVFLANAATGIDAVAVALAAGDVAEVAHATHRLKSSSGFLGARRLVALCADIEARAGADTLEVTPGLEDLLAGELELASAELVRRVGSAAAPDPPGR